MAKRNYVNEILSKKQRTIPNSRRWDLVSERLGHISTIPYVAHLLQYFYKLEGVEELEGYDWVKEDYVQLRYTYGLDSELVRYIPIGLVACIEGYFRNVYAELINHGSPYKENAAKFVDIKFSIETAISLEVNSVSLGDFVAHLLTTNNLFDINNNINTLVGGDFNFLKELKNARKKAIAQQYLFPIDENELNDYMIKSVKRMFELRHMFCHEIDPIVPDEDRNSIKGYPGTAIDFLWISEFLINELLSC